MKVSVLNLAKLSRQLGYLCAFLVAVTFSIPALAQDQHGVDVGKVCPTATKVGDLATCLLGVFNTDDFGDDIRVVGFFDVIDPGGANIRNPECPTGTLPTDPSCNLPIVAITEDPGAVTCEPAPPGTPIEEAPIGLVFPCILTGSGLNPPQPGGSGYGLVVQSQYTVPAGSEDPLVDQGFVTVQDACNIEPIGCNPGDQTQNFGAAVSLFVPSIDVTKTAVDTAKVGDEITYTIGFTDTTTGILPDPYSLDCTGNDPLLGGDLGAFTAGVPREFPYTVQVGDPDPLLNTATITCQVVGFDNIFANTDSHSVDLIAPSIEVTKTGPAQAKVGDEITYTIGFADTGIGALGVCIGSDPLLGGDLGVFVDGVTRDFSYTIQVGDADPLLNTATITCAVNGVDNVINDSDDHSMDLIAPSVDLAKACSPNPLFVDGTIEWAITVNNDGDTDLNCLVNDPTAGFVDEPVMVVAGGSDVLNASRIVGIADVPSISNTATVSCAIAGYDNEVTDSATVECPVFENNVAVPTLSDGSRWLLILMLPGVGLLLLSRYSLRLR